MKISVCIPTYKGVPYLKESLDSIFRQTYKDFELIICNDSQEDTEELKNLLDSYSEFEIHFYQNDKNLGYSLNLKNCVEKSSGEVLFLMGQDDILLQSDIFEKCVDIFEKYPEVGAITRPYYWFDESFDKPIRTVSPYPKRIINVQDEEKDLKALYETVGQLSALVYRKELITEPFNENVFTAHIYPFLSVLRTHDVYLWEDYNLAVRTSSSQTRFLSSIYNPSPTKTWVEMFQKVFSEKEFDHARKVGIAHITTNYIGLVQIKNYGHFRDLVRDIYYLVKYRSRNLLNLKFWTIVLGVLFVPRGVLRWLVDFYKNKLFNFRYLIGSDKNKESQIDKCASDYKAYIKNISAGFSKKKILDVGCGRGEYTALFLENENEVYATDIKDRRKPEYLDKIKFKKTKSNFTYPFDECSFDLIVSFDVIEHVEDDVLFVRELHRMCKPGGQAIVGTPNKYRLANVLRILSTGKRIGYPLFLGEDPDLGTCVHVREYTHDELKVLFEEHGFNEVSIQSFWFGLRSSVLEKFSLKSVPFPLDRLSQYYFVVAVK